MELVYILKKLWNKRWLVAVGLLLGGLAAVWVLQLGGRTVGTGSTEILIDAPKSTLGDLGRDIEPLTARGGIFTRLLPTDSVRDGIAAESGIPARKIVIVGPRLNIDGIPDADYAERATQLAEQGGYVVQVQQGDALPVLTVFTRAPTLQEARTLANASAVALEQEVGRIQEATNVPERRRLAIRQLGTAAAGESRSEPSRMLALAAFLGIVGIACLAILSWPAVVAAWRRPDPSLLTPESVDQHSSNGWHVAELDEEFSGPPAPGRSSRKARAVRRIRARPGAEGRGRESRSGESETERSPDS